MTSRAKYSWVVALFLFFSGFQTVFGQVKGDAPYQSPEKERCNEEFEKDAVWQAELKNRFRADLHEEESASMLRNNRHVVMAYGAIWVMMLGFMLYMYLKQNGLATEITRLEHELKKAADS